MAKKNDSVAGPRFWGNLRKITFNSLVSIESLRKITFRSLSPKGDDHYFCDFLWVTGGFFEFESGCGKTLQSRDAVLSVKKIPGEFVLVGFPNL